jgi:acyl carrier protein
VTPTFSEDFTQLIIQWIRRNRQARIPAGLVVTPETDLLVEGVLDSLGFVELLVYLETEHGCTIQLLDADPAEFSTAQGLSVLASKNNVAGSAAD